MQQTKLIVIEGLDGSGKATQAELLARRLRESGRNVKQISFPDYSSKSSALVKMYLHGEIGGVDDVNPYAASLFYASDRYISYMTGWKKEYLAGHTIIADRYTTSNAAHQTAKLPREQWDAYLDWLYDCEFERVRLPRPDIVLYLDLPPEVSQGLLEKRYGGQPGDKDIHESNLVYLNQCRQAALYAAERLGWKVIACSEGGAVLPVELITDKIMQEIGCNQ